MNRLLNILLVLGVSFAQHVSLYLDQVVYSDSENVDIYIYMVSDASIASFNFTLNGFDNILSTSAISPLCLSNQYLESLSFVEGYFSGGDTDNNPIPMGSGPFLTVSTSYNSLLLDGQYLTIEDIFNNYMSPELL